MGMPGRAGGVERWGCREGHGGGGGGGGGAAGWGLQGRRAASSALGPDAPPRGPGRACRSPAAPPTWRLPPGATRDIGSALTRMCMRHRSIETKLRQFTK